MRRDAAFCRLLIEREHRVCGSARFERADFLKVLAFKKQLCAGCFIQAGTRQDRRAMNEWPDAFMRRANTIEIDCHCLPVLYSQSWTRTQSGTRPRWARIGRRFRICRQMQISARAKIDNARSKRWQTNAARSRKPRGRS